MAEVSARLKKETERKKSPSFPQRANSRGQEKKSIDVSASARYIKEGSKHPAAGSKKKTCIKADDELTQRLFTWAIDCGE